MKKVFVLILVLITICGTACAELYPETARVISLDCMKDIVTIETFNGFCFAFNGCDGWEIDDCCALIMDDNGTELVYDDIIIMAEYSAWTLINWSLGE